jgi:hypothetical protein
MRKESGAASAVLLPLTRPARRAAFSEMAASTHGPPRGQPTTAAATAMPLCSAVVVASALVVGKKVTVGRIISAAEIQMAWRPKTPAKSEA